MIRGLYTAASGMLANLRQQEAVANNVANVNTPGYKAETSSKSSFGDVLATSTGNSPVPVPLTFRRTIGTVGTGTYEELRATDLRPGSARATGQPLDLAIVGRGFFVVTGPDGGPLYTRNGHFQVDEQNQLVTAHGMPVMDVTNQAITLDPTTLDSVEILQNGNILVGETPLATLQIVDIADDQIARHEGTLFVAVGPVQPIAPGGETYAQQGALEEANTDLASEATKLVSIARRYEASQRVFREITANLELAVRDVGRVG